MRKICLTILLLVILSLSSIPSFATCEEFCEGMWGECIYYYAQACYPSCAAYCQYIGGTIWCLDQCMEECIWYYDMMYCNNVYIACLNTYCEY